MSTPLISASQLREALAHDPGAWLLCDCRFDLAQPAAGEAAYATGHLPGAVYLHLDRDLSSPRQPGGGRHPLPDPGTLAARLAGLGAQRATRMVVYDGSGGMYAARLWWLLRWLGHGQVALLDGGLAAWQAAGGALESGIPPARPLGDFVPRPPLSTAVDYADVRAGLGRPDRLVVDARTADRFRGENETIDPVGGHIPGAVNRCFRDNLGPDGCFKPPEQLRAEWLAVMGGRPASALVQQCGSGVTACHNLLAMAQAGLDGSQLYAGSWSEWCHQPDAVVALG